VSDVLHSYDELFPIGPEERKISGRPELDLKDFWELRLDLFKKMFHFIRVPD
jgi:hypothetical protein